jgi:hypothetical protein
MIGVTPTGRLCRLGPRQRIDANTMSTPKTI